MKHRWRALILEGAQLKDLVQTLLSKRLEIDAKNISVYPVNLSYAEVDEKENETKKEEAIELPFMVDRLQPVRILQQHDMYKIVYGATLFASGGGGSLQTGLGLAATITGSVTMKSAKSTDVSCICPTIIGSPAALGDANPYQSVQTVMNVAAFADTVCRQKVERKSQIDIGGYYPIELGAVNTIIPFVLASHMKNKVVIDADIAGRSVPWINLTLLQGIPANPACIAHPSSGALSLFGRPLRSNVQHLIMRRLQKLQNPQQQQMFLPLRFLCKLVIFSQNMRIELFRIIRSSRYEEAQQSHIAQ